MSQIDLIKIYNPANQTKQQLINNFVVRLELFQEIFKDIKTSKMESPEQHYIIQGIRGQGKTTLLLRLAYEIQKDPKLNKWLIPVIFSEEQYSLRKLYKLWELTAEYLKAELGFESLYSDMQKLNDDIDYEVNCFQLLENRLKHNKKKLVLFIDNINDMFDRFKKKDCQRLREVLQQTSELRIIGASSVSIEFHYQYEQPFYEFFNMPILKGLTLPETQTLLLKLGEYYESEKVKEIVEEQTGRIEALRRLTGGVIRTIILLFNIFVDEEEGNAFNDLEDVLDKVTPLYKHRMDNLSPQQQEIMEFIALSWDAVSTKEISTKVKEKSKAVSAQLSQLVKSNLIEQQNTDTKNNLYRLSERFFNIWYLMRHGGKNEENKVKWLVQFLIEWCDDKTLECRAKKHLEALQKGKINVKQALYMTEAFNYTTLNGLFKDQIVKGTRGYLTDKKSELVDYLHSSDLELKEQASESYKSQDFDQYAKNLEKIRVKDDEDYMKLGIVHGFELHHPDIAEQNLLKAIDKGNVDAMFLLATLYHQKFKDNEKAEKYYLLAVEKGNVDAMLFLATSYHQEFKDFEKAEKYCLMAVEKGNVNAMLKLADLYEDKLKDFTKAEKYYLMAVEKDDVKAMSYLAHFYSTKLKDFAKAEKYYLMAVEKGNVDAMLLLAALYHQEFKDNEKAEKYYLMVVEKGNVDAMFLLATLYHQELKDYEKAERYYLMAVEKDDVDAIGNLAALYEEKLNDLPKAEKYYLMAVDKGSNDALNSLSWMLFENAMKKKKALNYSEKQWKFKKNMIYAHTYASILLWNNEIEKALEISNEFLEDKEAYDKFPEDIRQFLMLLIAKKQYHSAYKIFNENPMQLKDRFKPLYYALMYFLQKDYPNEYIKMGSELKQTVDEIIDAIKKMSMKYA